MKKLPFVHYYPHPQHRSEGLHSSLVLPESQKGPDLHGSLSRTPASAPPPADVKGPCVDLKQMTKLAPLPRAGWSSSDATNAKPDLRAAGESQGTRWRPKPDRDDTSKVQVWVLDTEDACPPKEPIEEVAAGKWKASLPPRLLPPKMKWVPSVKDENLPKNSAPPQTSGQKACQRWRSLPSPSSSSSEPEAPSGQERLSLRISESCIQVSPTLLPREEEDDEVFFKEAQPLPADAIAEHSPPPLPPLPPALNPVDECPLSLAATQEAEPLAADKPTSPGEDRPAAR